MSTSVDKECMLDLLSHPALKAMPADLAAHFGALLSEMQRMKDDLTAANERTRILSEWRDGAMVAIDSLQQQANDARAALTTMTDDRNAKSERMWELGHECDRLQQSLTASEKDAARYRWLRDVAEASENEAAREVIGDEEYAVDLLIYEGDGTIVYESGFGTDAIDAAIDAAMEKANG